MTFGVIGTLLLTGAHRCINRESVCSCEAKSNNLLCYINKKKSLTRSRDDGAQRTSVKLDIVTRKSASYLYIS